MPGYDPTNPGSTRNKVRRLVGDTVAAHPLLDDAEIDLYLPGGDEGRDSVGLAAIAVLDEILIPKADHAVTFSESGYSAQLSDYAAKLRKRRDELQAQYGGGASSIAAGLVTAITTDTYGNTRDRAFTRRMGDPSAPFDPIAETVE